MTLAKRREKIVKSRWGASLQWSVRVPDRGGTSTTCSSFRQRECHVRAHTAVCDLDQCAYNEQCPLQYYTPRYAYRLRPSWGMNQRIIMPLPAGVLSCRPRPEYCHAVPGRSIIMPSPAMVNRRDGAQSKRNTFSHGEFL